MAATTIGIEARGTFWFNIVESDKGEVLIVVSCVSLRAVKNASIVQRASIIHRDGSA